MSGNSRLRMVVAAAAVLALTAVLMPASGAAAATGPIDRRNRTAVIDAYKNWLRPALGTPAAFTGEVAACNPGVETDASRAATMSAVNYYRSMAGLPAVAEHRDWSIKAQQAAVMMDAQSRLSRGPFTGWRCNLAGGAEAAPKSNLSLGTAGAQAIARYMLNPGSSNEAVADRRWILHPPTTQMGTGSTTRANALWAREPVTSPRPAVAGGWVAWPPAGYVPWEVLPYADAGKQLFRWSLSSNDLPNADYNAAHVSVKFGAEELVVAPYWDYEAENGTARPGDSTLVWTAWRRNFERFPIEGDATFTVNVSGVQTADGTAVAPLTYQVNAVRAVPDTTPPPALGFLRTRAGLGRVALTWSRSTAPDFKGFEVRVRQGGRSPSRTEGRRVCRVMGTEAARTCTARNLDPTVSYSFSAFAFDYAGNYSRRRAALVRGTAVTSATSRSRVPAGDRVRIFGSLYQGRPSNHTLMANKQVTLQRRLRRANGTWRPWVSLAGRRTTNGPKSFGAYSFRPSVTSTAQFRVLYRGDHSHTGAVSPARKVTARKVTARR